MTEDKKPVVLVEDDDLFAEIFAVHYRRAGITNELIHVKSGYEALDLFWGAGSHADKDVIIPALIIMDVRLPGLNGVDVAITLRNGIALAKIPIIAISAFVEPDDRNALTDAGVNYYYEKSGDLTPLMNEVKAILASSSYA